MSKTLRIGEMEETRTIIGQHIGHTQNEVMEWYVSVMALMEGLQS
jgi:hypothetical protein